VARAVSLSHHDRYVLVLNLKDDLIKPVNISCATAEKIVGI
jgi:hypothetical protein